MAAYNDPGGKRKVLPKRVGISGLKIMSVRRAIGKAAMDSVACNVGC